MAHDIDVVTLRLYVAVCEEGNIARAAEREALVASAVSRRISAIEDEAGTALLIRGRRGVLLTPADETMLRQAREVLRAMDRLRAELADFSGGVHSHVRVVAAPAALSGRLVEDLGGFLEASPGVALSMDERPSPEVARAVRDGAAEVGVLWGAMDLHDFDVEPYWSDRLCLVVRPGHVLAGRRRIHFEEAIDYISIVVAPGGALDTMMRREAARLSRRMSYRVEVSGLDVAVRLVAAGMGSVVLPRAGGAGTSKAASVILVPLVDAWARRDYMIIAGKGRAQSTATSNLIAHLKRLGDHAAQSIGPPGRRSR